MTNVLELRVITDGPNHPKLQILVDGQERLRGVGRNDTRNDVADVLDTEALVPRSEPHRVALYGCSCGEFGCAVLTTLVVGEDDSVRWTDFRASAGGPYERSLPDSPLADPFADLPVLPRQQVDLPDLTFDRGRYLDAIRELAAGRPWETRARAVIRHVGYLLPGIDWAGPDVEGGWYVTASWEGDEPVVWVGVREGRLLPKWEVPLPDGPAEQAAAQLVETLQHVHPRDVDGARLVER